MVKAAVKTQVGTAEAAVAAKFFRGLGDPTRLRIVQLLLEGEKNVGELVSLIGAPQGRVSTHLACLRWCGFVSAHRQGRNVIYRLSDPRVRDLVILAQSIIIDNAKDIASCRIIK